MPMVPGLSVDMPSRVGLDENLFLFSDDSLPPSFLDTEAFNFDGDILHNALESLPSLTEYINDSPLFSNVIKRDCSRCGRPEDMCSMECQLEEDYSDYMLTRHNPILSNEQVSADYQMVNPQHVLQVQYSYSPYNDHSYYQTIGYPDDFETKASDSYESESLSDDSVDEIVDVETVQVEPPAANKVPKRRGRKPGQKLKSSVAKSLAPNKRTGLKRKGKNLQHGRARKRQKWSKGSCEPSPVSSDAEEIGKRCNHNDMERQRRNEQKNRLQALRQIVPAVKDNAKTPKVSILRHAAAYILELQNKDEHYQEIKCSQRERQTELEHRLKQLHRELKLR